MGLLEILILVLVLGWMFGFGFHVAGGLIHILIVIALILFIIRLARGSNP